MGKCKADYRGKCKAVKPLWKTWERLLKKLKIGMWYGLAIALLGL